MDELNSHCSFCAHSYPPGAHWPRTCEKCGHISGASELEMITQLCAAVTGRTRR